MSPTTTKQRRRRLQISRGPGRAEPSPGGSSRGSPGSGGDAPGPPPAQRPPWPAIASPKPAHGSAAEAPGEGVPAPKPPSPLPVRVGQGDLRGNSGSLPRASPPPAPPKDETTGLEDPCEPCLGEPRSFRAHGRRLRFLIPFLAPPAHLPPAHAQRTNRPPKK